MTNPSPSATRRAGRLLAAVVAVSMLASPLVVAGGAAAQEPLEDGEIAGLTLSSDSEGQLTVAWQTPTPAPRDYRLLWACESLAFLSWRDANEAGRGNEYPAGTETSLTLSGLTAGETCKVKLRARYGPGNGHPTPWSGPWTAIATVTVTTSTDIQQRQKAALQRSVLQQESDDGPSENDEPPQLEVFTDDEPLISLQQNSVPAVDEAASTSTTATLTVGTLTTGGLHHVGDTDWFKFTVVSTLFSFQFDVYDDDHEDGGTAYSTEIKAIYDSSGTKVADSGNDRLVNRLGAGTHYNTGRRLKRANFVAQVTGVYYVEVGVHDNYATTPDAFSDGDGNPRSYQVAVVADDYGVSTNRGTVAVGGSATGTIFQKFGSRGNDIDDFSVTGLQPGGKYQFVLHAHATSTGQQASSLTLSDLYATSAIDPVPTTRSESMGPANRRWVRKAVHVGSSYTAGSPANISVQANNSPGLDYTLYLWSASEDSYDEDDHGAGDETADFGETEKTALFTPGHLNSQTAGESVYGVIDEPGDSDWYRSWIDLRSAYTITLSQEEENGCLRVRLLKGYTGPHSSGTFVRADSAFSVSKTIELNYSGRRHSPAHTVGMHYIVVEGGPTYVHKTDSTERCDRPSNLSDYNVVNRETEYDLSIDGPDN